MAAKGKHTAHHGRGSEYRRDFIGESGAALTADEVEFGRAMERFQRQSGKPFPDCADVLLVIRGLGYRRVE
jgi:hypothetical protein